MAQIADIIRLAADVVIFRSVKNETLTQLVHGMIDFKEYNDIMAKTEHWMNAIQFRYIDKHKVMDLSVAKKEFELAPEDLSKFNYN